eukprot:TRINITY_DN5082_c0_g1_i1.p1 TRINITY_DN5082_c0_g1~~TRINITY_DN5082_c0_g1_i1.p1  ORF type:complete len:365 (-),score=80.56 TRINITY_DN5082_c0_g1_i1:142-1236(-)
MLQRAARLCTLTCRRQNSTLAWAAEAKALVFEANGDPRSVIKCQTLPLPQTLGAEEVQVAMLHAPINPADINIVQGVYGIRPKLPAVGGSEGVAVVLRVGPAVESFSPGDWVIPHRPASGSFGTWRTHAVAHQDELVAIPNDIPVSAAATIGVNPCTAYRMLHDFAIMSEGDVVVQNGANSAVGQCVIQVAKARGLRTINIIRDQSPFEEEETKKLLSSIGADIVVTESFAQSYHMKDLLQEHKLGNARLGLNCVGGDSVITLSNLLAPGGKIVTYGGMSRRPVTVSTGQLLFKQIEMRGFWMTRWVDRHTKEQRMEMLRFIADLIRKNKLKIWTESHELTDFNETFTRYFEPGRGPKLLFKLN